MKSLYAAFQFLTILPLRKNCNAEQIGRAVRCFTPVGALIGLSAAAVASLAEWLGAPDLTTALLSVGVLGAVSGFLHLDGLADTADGFLSSRPRERILEIMRDSRVGAMGVIVLLFTLALKVSSVAALDTQLRWRALMLAAAGGRTTQMATMLFLPYARREGGLGSLFREHCRLALVIVSLLVLITTGLLLCNLRGIIALGAAALASLLFNRACLKKIGGMTGDTLGAVSEISETTILLSLSVPFNL